MNNNKFLTNLKMFLFCLLGFFIAMLDVNYNLAVYHNSRTLGVPLLGWYASSHIMWDFTLLLIFVNVGLILLVDVFKK